MAKLPTYEEIAKKVAEEALDGCIYKGKTLREWIDILRQTRWIPVSERLPEDRRPVLIYAWNVHHVVARYGNYRTENGYRKCWVTADAWNGNTEIKHDVIAWMPLPEPYKAESEEAEDEDQERKNSRVY